MADVAVIDSYYIDCTDTVYIECKIAYWLWRTIPFTLLTIGLFGNILNFVVLSRQRIRKHSTTVYLLFLAGTDMLFLLFGLLPDTVYSITGIRFADYSNIFCRIRLWILYTSGAFSVWLLVLLTIERVLLTKIPVVTKAKLTPKTSFVVSFIILIILALANMHCITGFKHHASKEEIRTEFGQDLVQVLHFPCTYATRNYMTFFTGTWGTIILVVFNVLPATIIVVGNVTIAVDIIMRRRRLNRIHPSNHTPSGTQQRTATFELATRTNSPLNVFPERFAITELPKSQARTDGPLNMPSERLATSELPKTPTCMDGQLNVPSERLATSELPKSPIRMDGQLNVPSESLATSELPKCQIRKDGPLNVSSEMLAISELSNSPTYTDGPQNVPSESVAAFELSKSPKHMNSPLNMPSERLAASELSNTPTRTVGQRNVPPEMATSHRTILVTRHTDLKTADIVSHTGSAARLQRTRPITTTIKVKRSRSPTRILFTLSIFFMITTFPYTLQFVIKAGLSELSEEEIARWRLITVSVLICGWCNYTFNFFLYFVSGTLFKQEWNRLLQEGKVKLRNMFG